MPRFRSAVLALFLLALSTTAHGAPGVVSMTWGETCTPIVQDITPAAGPQSIVVSVAGSDEIHNAYVVVLLFGAADDTVPDAWQFEAGGCQGPSRIQIDHLPPASLAPSCPAFSGANLPLVVKNYEVVPPTSPFPQTLRRGVVASVYVESNTAVATQRYFLARFRFDHSFSVAGATTPGVDCGGLATPMCIRFVPSGSGTLGAADSPPAYVRHSDGVVYEFQRDGADFLTTNGGGGCGTTPAVPSTWGAVKGQYRR